MRFLQDRIQSTQYKHVFRSTKIILLLSISPAVFSAIATNTDTHVYSLTHVPAQFISIYAYIHQILVAVNHIILATTVMWHVTILVDFNYILRSIYLLN